MGGKTTQDPCAPCATFVDLAAAVLMLSASADQRATS